MGYSENERGEVVLTISMSDWQKLLLALPAITVTLDIVPDFSNSPTASTKATNDLRRTKRQEGTPMQPRRDSLFSPGRGTALALALLAMPAMADPIFATAVSCKSYGAPTITGISTCEEGGPLNPYGASPSYAYANASASVTLQTAASDWLTIRMQNTVNAVDGAVYLQSIGQLPPNQLLAPASASASIAVHLDSYTTGPVRPGILQIQWAPLWQGSYGDWSATAGYTIEDPLLYLGSLTGTCSGSYGMCTGPGVHAPPIPFQLGTSFSLDSYADLRGSSIDGVANGYDGMLLQFRFLEADGITPVLSIDPVSAPEPAAFGLVMLAFVAGYMQTRRDKTQWKLP